MSITADAFEKLLLKELPEDVWLELSLTASDISRKSFLERRRITTGVLIGYLKVHKVQSPYSGISINGECYIAIRHWNEVYCGFVFKGKTSDWFDINLNDFNVSEIDKSGVFEDLYNNPYYSYGGRIFV